MAMDADVQVESVETSETKNGNTRWILRDGDGREYTTFRPPIGKEAERFRGKRAHIEFHEESKGSFTNVYLDSVGPPSAPAGQSGEEGSSDPDEAAWNTAVEAAPWLVGTAEPEDAVDPDELYEKLEPFKQRVSEDIRSPPPQG
jgi:hypothetical protein